MKKILFVVTKSNFGGAQRYVFDLATGLPKDRFEAVVAAGGTGGKNAAPGLLSEKLRSAGLRFVPVKNFMRDIYVLNDIKAFFELISLFRREKPDAVHLNSSKAVGIGALAARLCGIKKIVGTAHGFAIDENRPPLQKFIISILSFATAVLATDVIVLSRRDEKRMLKWPFISQKKVHRISNGTRDISFIEKSQAIAGLNINNTVEDGTKIIGTIAELTSNKGLDIMLEALALLANRKWIWVLIGQGELENKLRSRAKELGISQNVYFAGFVPDASSYMRAFDVFVLPSRKEGLPYVLLEAGLASLPVVASNIGGIPDLIEDRLTGLLANPDPDSLSHAITEMLSSPAESARYGENLKEKVRAEFSLEKMIELSSALYE